MSNSMFFDQPRPPDKYIIFGHISWIIVVILRGPIDSVLLLLFSRWIELRVHEEYILKTAFRMQYGHFEFTVMPLGLTNAPSSKEDHEVHLMHVVNSNGIHVDPSMIETMRNWKASKTPTQYGHFEFTVMPFGLTNAPSTLKEGNLCNAPILSLPDGSEDFVVYCDTSNEGLGCVLMKRGKVIAYALRQFKIYKKNYSTHDLELGAVVFALKTWRHYLYRTKIVIYTDHKSLQHIFDQKELNMRQIKWIELFSDYDCEIRYHQWKANEKLLAAQHKTSKEENTPAEMLCVLDQQMEKKEDGGLYFMDKIWVPSIALGTRLDMSTVYHPQTGGQSERTIQTLEDMLRVCVIDFGSSWDTHLPLAEFFYNNSYHLSIQCALFEALYGRNCRLPILWAEVEENRLISLKMVKETIDKVVLIRQRLKAARDHQKSYADNRRKLLEFEVGPFEILERIGPVAYRLRFPQELSSVHDTFHVSNLKKCLADANLHVPLEEIMVYKTLYFFKEPVEAMDCGVKKLKHSRI
nr:hypothetical protein [Tanacetum cinerariifolium]